MAEETVPICRLCLETVFDGQFQEAESIIIILQNVLPDLNFSVSRRPLICTKCTETVQKLYNFKSACLETEKQLLNYRPNGSSTINLEEVIHNKCSENGVKIEKIDKGKICRFCVQILEGEVCIQLGVIEKDMLRKCLPDLDLTVSENPVICGTCLECLHNQFNFITSCSDVEERINNYCLAQGTNSNDQVNLHDMLIHCLKTPVDKLNRATSNQYGDIKAELDDDDSSNMEHEEISIKDEISAESTQEDSFDTSDGDMSGNWLDDTEKLPHELDHDYISNQPSFNYGLSNTSRLSKEYKMKHFIKPRKETQTLHVLKKTILRLEKKLKYYQGKYQMASDKLRNIHRLLKELKNKNLITEEAYQEIMACK